MPLSPYFLQGSSSEQRLVQDLINEQLKIYGQDVVYLPRKIINKNTIMKEETASTFDDAFRMEAYLVNYEGFEGSGDVLSKFGIQTTDAISFVISKERYEDFISPFLTVDTSYQLASRPEEGDLIYLPLDNTMFEIKYVEGKKPFYQLNNLYVYTLSCEVMDYALDERIDSGIEEVDKAAVEFGFTIKLTMVGVDATTATATAQLARELVPPGPTGNSVNRIDLINDGTGYTIAPLIGIATAPTSGINATAVAIMTSRTGQTGQSIDRIEITNPGYGYTVPPTITIRSQNAFGTGGIATALISPTSIGAPVITGGGSGYAFPSEISPTVTFTPPSSRATATATIEPTGTLNILTITSPGVGYTGVPTVTISAPPSGVTAIATATISGGEVTGLTINNAGSGYDPNSPPTVTISNQVGIKTWTGELAEAVSFLNTNGELNVIRYINAGVGYTSGSAPEITISSPTKAGLSTGDYLFKEMVRGVSTGTTAFVSDWDRDTRVLKVTTPSGTFLTGETVVGIGTTMLGSDSQYVIQSKTDENDDDTFGDNLNVETEADAIIDFSEDNPFGDF